MELEGIAEFPSTHKFFFFICLIYLTEKLELEGTEGEKLLTKCIRSNVHCKATRNMAKSSQDFQWKSIQEYDLIYK